ncbi:MAG: DNA mismatch repair endonuclease MutL [Oscillospiraceae bacterium]
MGKIHILSKEVAELIAAGEVIDRPASVVKELVENAIDAGATVITAEIKNGGRTYIRITDNGAGIAAEDLPTAFVRHATSKIQGKRDLDAIRTLGFRGEALASIAAVSRTEVLSKRPSDAFGTRYCIEGTQEKLTENCGCPDGTTFLVRDLFYNVPARLKFLKKDVTEGNAIAAIFSKLALSHPEISVKFIRDNKPELVTSGDGRLYSAVYAVFGREFAVGLMPVNFTANGVTVSGFVSKPLSARANRSFQNFFLNGRYVRSVTCMVSLEEAFRNAIMTGKFPACVLCLEIPPEMMDVNVHPTKVEVRFTNEKLIYDSVYFAVKNAILADEAPANLTMPAQRFFSERELREVPVREEDRPVQLMFAAPETPAAPQPATETFSPESSKKPAPPQNEPREIAQPVQPIVTAAREQYKNSDTIISAEEIPPAAPEQEFQYLSGADFERKAAPQPPVRADVPEKPRHKVIGELFGTYIVAEAGEDMFLYDKHAAHERLIFERISGDAAALASQLLLEPVMVMLSFEEYDAVQAHTAQLAALGFTVECDVAPAAAVTGIPSVLGDVSPADILPQLAQDILHNKRDPRLDLIGEFYHSVACKAAIKAHDTNSRDELQALVNAVSAMDAARYCPHGRPFVIKLSRREIEKQFKRIV